jgi:cytochrome P450
MLALIEHPEQRARLMADRTLLPSAIEEMLRWVAPLNVFRRTATRDV